MARAKTAKQPAADEDRGKGRKRVTPVMPPATLAAARGEKKRGEAVTDFVTKGASPAPPARAPKKARERPDPASDRPTKRPPFELPPSERRSMALASGVEVQRVNFLFPPKLVYRLKRFTVDRGGTMTSSVIAIVDGYLRESGY